jgi:hypothetical protein
MSIGVGVDISKGHALVICPYEITGDLSVNDFGENASHGFILPYLAGQSV